MFNKKVKAILFIFLILCCIATVNATEIDYNTDVKSINIVDVKNDSYVATIAENAGSYTDLNNDINGNGNINKNSITLNRNYTYNSQSDENYRFGIVIGRNLTIDGQGHTISGSNLARIFNITTGNLTIKNLNIVNGSTYYKFATSYNEYGGAIFSNGNLIVINSTFKNNSPMYGSSSSASSPYGGAIYINGELTIINSTFEDNYVNGSSYGYGGAIYSYNGGVLIINSTFNNNNACYSYFGPRGGAIYSRNSNVTLINSTFNNNHAHGEYQGSDGGVIYLSNSSNVITIINSTFKNNTASGTHYAGYGAAISSNGILIIFNSSFIGNDGNGGVIYNSGRSITITNTNFTNNTGDSIRTNNDPNVVIVNTNFTDNNGSGIVLGSSGNLTVINSTFINNTADNGAAIWGTKVTVINSIFINNTATETGGAIYVRSHFYDCLLNITNSIFENNTANNGGAIFIDGSIMPRYYCNINITNSTFTNNNAVENGGAIYINDNQGNVTLNDLKLSYNTANSNGGAIYITDYRGNITTENLTFTNNKAVENGSAIYIDSGYYGCDMNLTNSNFTQNNAKNGGVIYSTGNTNITIINSNLNKNIATENGGAIFSDMESIVTVTNSNFSNNTALNKGGAIYSENANVQNSTFTNNTANQFGGAIYLGIGHVYESIFINNTATNGGAISIGTGNTTLSKSKFINNTATNGGAIYYKNMYYEMVLEMLNSDYYREYLKMIEELYPDEYPLYIEMIEYQLKMISELSTLITNCEFEDNQGLGDDIYTCDNTTVLNNNYTKNSYANIYANHTIVNCTVITVLGNMTHILNESKFKAYATVYLDGATVQGYELVITDGTNNYNTTYVGNGTYETDFIIAGRGIKHYSAIINNETNNSNYYVKNGTVINNKKIVNIEVSLDENDYGEEITGNITLKDENDEIANITGQVTIEIDGKNYTANITNGTGNFVIDDQIDAGNHTLKATFDGDKDYDYSNTTIDFEIGKANPELDVNITEIDGNLTMDIIMNPDINGNVTVTIDNDTFVVEIRNGSGSLDLSDLESGVHDFKVDFEGNNNYNPAETAGKFDTNGIVLEVDYLTKYYGNTEKLNIRLRDALGNPIANQNITIKINGVTYTRTTDENGQVLMSINLIPGVYETEVSYENMTEVVNVTIISTIQADDLIKYFKNGSQYYAKFLDVDGTPLANTNVTFNIHGVFYTRTTDADGIAKLNINLNPGEYIITAWNPVNTESKSNIITVLSTIFGQNVIKYYRNGTQYYARVLDANGNPLANANVTFNIHGVFYNRTSNEEGIVKLNINLNPGEYIITAWNLWNGEAKSNNITVYNVVLSQDLEMTTSARKPFKVTILGEQGKPLANAQVSFNIHGVFYYKTTDANGEVSLNINLVAGKYIITTYYNEYAISNTITVK